MHRAHTWVRTTQWDAVVGSRQTSEIFEESGRCTRIWSPRRDQGPAQRKAQLLFLPLCEGVGDVVGVEAPLGGVAQVIFHGVQVVEVGLQFRVHEDRGEEEDGEGQVEVEREVEEIKENNTCATCG